jgi:hypothetical protein
MRFPRTGVSSPPERRATRGSQMFIVLADAMPQRSGVRLSVLAVLCKNMDPPRPQIQAIALSVPGSERPEHPASG